MLDAYAPVELVRGFVNVAAHQGKVAGAAAFGGDAGTTVTEQGGALHVYLTWAEAMKLACQAFHKDVGKLSRCAA